jgi:REase_MTES_1575
MSRSPGRRGLRPLGRVLNAYRPLPETRSPLERRFIKFCRRAALPPPAINVEIAGLEVDAVWHDARLAVELDSRGFHQTRAAFERDRVRDATLQLAGYRILRVTDRRLRSEPEAVARTIRTLLRPSPH